MDFTFTDDDEYMKLFVFKLALLETPSGFALFNIDDKVFEDPDAIWARLAETVMAKNVAGVIGYVKVDDKSVTRRSDGPGEELSKLIRRFCKSGNGKELYVEDEKLRRVIYSNLKIKCSDDNYVVGEVMWGLKNLMYDLVYEEPSNLTRGYNLPPCDGLKKCITKFKFNISPEMVDEKIIINAGGLYRCYAMLKTTGKDLRKECEHHVPRICHLTKDDKLCAEVMAKILTPGRGYSQIGNSKFENEMSLKLEAADAAAKDAREKVGYRMYHFMYATFLNLTGLPGIIEKAVEFINALIKERCMGPKLQRAEKRSRSEAVGEAKEPSSLEEDRVDANDEESKKARTC